MSEITIYAADIAKLHQQAQQHAESAVQCAMQAGQLLIKAKADTRHGEWLPFVESAGMSARTAQRYMRLADNADILKIVTHDAFESISQALEYLAEPKQKLPVMGEYLHSEKDGEETWIWPADADYFHYVVLKENADGGGVTATSKRAMAWRGIEHVFPDWRTLNKRNGDPIRAFEWRDFALKDMANYGENYDPLKPVTCPNVAALVAA